MSGERSPHQAASLKRLERKVDQLLVAVEQDREATARNTRRLDTINLNGSAAALKRLADNTDQLLKLAEVAPIVVEAIERERDFATWWKVTRRVLNPLKPIGAFIWLLFTTVAAAIAWNLVTHH